MTKRSADKPQGLPAHWRRGRLLAAFCVFGIVVCATFLGRGLGTADRADNWWLRARFSFRESQVLESKPDPNIVMVDIDDRTSDAWPEPMPFWGPHYAAAIKHVVAGKAKLIACDFIQQSTPSFLAENGDNADKAAVDFMRKFDTAFGEALRASPDVVMAKALRRAAGGKTAGWVTPSVEVLYSLPGLAKNPDWNPEESLGYVDLGKQAIAAAFKPRASSEATAFSVRIAERFLGVKAQAKGATMSFGNGPQIPLREDGSFLINYASHTKLPTGQSDVNGTLQYFPLLDVAQGKVPASAFEGKVVIIGASNAGLNDLHHIPFFEGTAGGVRLVSGPQVQANILRTLLSGNPIREPSQSGIWLLSTLLGLLGLLAFSRFRWVTAALLCTLAATVWICASLWIFNTDDFALPINLPLSGLLLSAFLMGGYRALGEERERRQVMGLWGRYQNPVIVEYLLEHPEARGGEGSENQVTVLFADLKNFTKTVEMLEPRDALRMLNRYLGLMEEVISKYGGCVDKYLGDGLMAEWGVPSEKNAMRPGEHHATSAVLACIELEKRTQELTDSIASDRSVTFGLRLTLHTGPVVVGWVGANRLEFTIIGDTVNVTSRLQETAKQLDAEFLVSESTYECVKEWITTGKEADVEIRGRQQPLRVYEVTGMKEGALPAPTSAVAATPVS